MLDEGHELELKMLSKGVKCSYTVMACLAKFLGGYSVFSFKKGYFKKLEVFGQAFKREKKVLFRRSKLFFRS